MPTSGFEVPAARADETPAGVVALRVAGLRVGVEEVERQALVRHLQRTVAARDRAQLPSVAARGGDQDQNDRCGQRGRLGVGVEVRVADGESDAVAAGPEIVPPHAASITARHALRPSARNARRLLRQIVRP